MDICDVACMNPQKKSSIKRKPVKYLVYLYAIMGRKRNKCSLFAFTVTIKWGKDVSGRFHMAFFNVTCSINLLNPTTRTVK